MKLVGTVTLVFFALITILGAKPIRIGVTPGIHAVIMEFVQKEANTKGLDIKLFEFSDYILPNRALAEGDLDLNIFQHGPFLEKEIEERGYKIRPIAKSILAPMAIYSVKLSNLRETPERARVSIPNDPTNGGRALLLLQKVGLLKLKDDADTSAMVLDITQNTKHLRIHELQAALLPPAIWDVDLAVINMDWALLAGLDPSKALAHEGIDSPYVNVIVARDDNFNDTEIVKFVKIYQSQETRDFIKNRFGNEVIPAWDN